MRLIVRTICLAGLAAFELSLIFTLGLSTTAHANSLTIDDVLRTVEIERVAPSPDGQELAVVLQRPTGDGEVAGRTSYEVDPSRNDVWLVRRDGSSSRNLTAGRALAAGYWCAQWSPGGQHLAMLSTRPEGSEPHGGNAVRLYLWKRSGETLQRLSDQPMMTMTRHGSPLNALDLRGGAGPNHKMHSCAGFDEGAPFLWLDENRILVVQMPPGQNSALFTQYGGALHSAGETAQRLRSGQVSTVDLSDSDRGWLASALTDYQAEIAVIDTRNGSRQLLARVPAFPFRGMLSIVVSPDRKVAAVLAPTGIIPLHEIGPEPLNNDDTQTRKQLAVIDISGILPTRWVTMPEETRYPLDLLDWSADSSALLLRARDSGGARMAHVFRLDLGSESIASVAPNILVSAADAGPWPHEPSARWAPDNTILLRGRPDADAKAPDTWWRVAPEAKAIPASPPGSTDSPDLPENATLLARDEHGTVWKEITDKGLAVREKSATDEAVRDLLVVNQHLASVDWGEVSTIDYVAEDGQKLKALIILPPGHRQGQRHPALVWVYPGTMIGGLGEYWDDHMLPGIYNLQLYAAQGYIVLVPSMPLAYSLANGPYEHMTNGVLPAVDRLLDLNVVDRNRVGVFGQSFGGYATYALVTQTDRFAAAAAIAGISDFTMMYGAFDRGADGWSGIAQDKSANPVIAVTAMRMPGPAHANPERYAANSPLNHVAAISTPLLIAHGSLDTRGSIAEAEAMFTMLERQGKPARLLRYHGENHAIALSPANVRNLYRELIQWFDVHLKDSLEVDRP